MGIETILFVFGSIAIIAVVVFAKKTKKPKGK